MSYKIALFDVDGTIIHTDHDFIVRSLGKAFDKFRVDYDPGLALRIWFDDDRDKILSKEFGVDVKKFWSYYNKHAYSFEERKNSVDVYSAKDRQVVACLKNKLNVGTGIVSSNVKECLDMEVGFFGRHLFDYVACTNHVPKADGLRASLGKFGVMPEEALYVGNSAGDILSSNAIGIDCAVIDRKEYGNRLVHNFKFEKLEDVLSLF